MRVKWSRTRPGDQYWKVVLEGTPVHASVTPVAGGGLRVQVYQNGRRRYDHRVTGLREAKQAVARFFGRVQAGVLPARPMFARSAEMTGEMGRRGRAMPLWKMGQEWKAAAPGEHAVSVGLSQMARGMGKVKAGVDAVSRHYTLPEINRVYTKFQKAILRAIDDFQGESKRVLDSVGREEG